VVGFGVTASDTFSLDSSVTSCWKTGPTARTIIVIHQPIGDAVDNAKLT